MRRGLTFRFLKWHLGLRADRDADLDRAYAEQMARWVRESCAVDRAVAFAMDGVYDEAGNLDLGRTAHMVGNDYLFDVCREHPELLPGASVNPARRDALEEIDRVADRGAVLVKLLPNSQDFDPAERRHRPFFRRCADLGMPIVCHTGFEHTIPVTRQEYGDPRRLAPALEEGATVIAAHSGSSGVFHAVEYVDHFVEMLERYPNLYGDTAAFATPVRRRYLLRFLERPDLLERLLHGSDFPIPVPPWTFADLVGPARTWDLWREKNPFARDAAVKRALGVPDSVFTRAARLLRWRDGGRAVAAPPPGGGGVQSA
jgi:hypothetical protein